MSPSMRSTSGWPGSRSTRYGVRDFLVRAARRGRSRDLAVPIRPRPDPVALDEDSHREILNQCLGEQCP